MKITENLTIVIPTYNRKERLILQLKSIIKQDLSGVSKILIIDNNSDYNISKE